MHQTMKLSILIGAALIALPRATSADTMRPAIGKPLQQAEALIQKQDYRAALLKVQQASAVGGLTKYETVVIAQVRGMAAADAGDYGQAASAYQTVLASGTEPPATQMQLIQAITGFYYEEQNYSQTITWVNRYIAVHGNDLRTRALLAQSFYQEGDYSHAEQAAGQEVKAAQVTGQALPEGELQLFASTAQKSNDQSGYAAALEALLKAYPSPTYWMEAIAFVTGLPGFPDQLTLDVYRLKLATGTLTVPADYEDYTERAILASRWAEAKMVIDKGFGLGILTPQTDAGHAARLRTLAERDAATHPQEQEKAGDEASLLDRGIAYFYSGANDRAIQNFEDVPDYATDFLSNPPALLARLWAICIQNDMKAKP
jgi:hypothetical protein